VTTNFEKYLAGEPINEVNAAVQRGELPAEMQTPLPGDAPRAPLADADRPLKQDERAALREMRQGPGWPVLQRLLERATISHTNAAILLSQEDPAGKTEDLAAVWLTVKVWKHMVNLLNQMVETELQQEKDSQ
jgi:hypothetical protein